MFLFAYRNGEMDRSTEMSRDAPSKIALASRCPENPQMPRKSGPAHANEPGRFPQIPVGLEEQKEAGNGTDWRPQLPGPCYGPTLSGGGKRDMMQV